MQRLCDDRFEHGIAVSLENTKGVEVGLRCVLVVKSGQVKALVVGKGLVGDNLQNHYELDSNLECKGFDIP
jgi:hypothetical protein